MTEAKTPTYRQAREAAGLTDREAACMLSVRVASLRRVESGDWRPSAAVRAMMLALYDVHAFAEDA